ncbi:MAG: TIR domain-containing protein [Lachnospiraceae bacterium]|nr:TIR domain-containing protein [Lachnospiraceae bacterium]
MPIADRYNAFISYRHSKKDNVIAKEIQSGLEHFRIPSKIAKKTGFKRFDRIFRDKEELPITSDLDNEIEAALKVSDYLIVICSTHTGESVWVQREIETFLKYHSKKNIFTVLVDGEPDEVIPDILLHDTVTRKLADGTTITQEEIIEPLSCDYRMPLRAARNEELPRLAASMLGCAYDELMRRRRQYRIHRAIAAISATACILGVFIAYLLWSMANIRKNYDQALLNQSRYYATESGYYLEKGDRVTAVWLALAGLPTKGNERPLSTETVNALTDALGTYIAPGSASFTPVWSYDSHSPSVKFSADNENKILASLDKRNILSVWDLKTHELRTTLVSSGGVLDFAFDSDNRLVLICEDALKAYDVDSLDLLWETKYDNRYISHSSTKLSVSKTKPLAAYNGGEKIVLLNTETGKLQRELTMDDFSGTVSSGNIISTLIVNGLRISPDGTLLEISAENYSPNASDEYNGLYLYNVEKDDLSRIYEGDFYYLTGNFTADNKVIIATNDDVANSSLDFAGRGILNTTGIHVYLFSSSGEELWECPLTYVSTSYQTRVFEFNFTDENGRTVPGIVAFYSDQCAMIDATDGSVIKIFDLTSSFISAYSTGTYLRPITRNGSYLTIPTALDDSSVLLDQYFTDEVESSCLVINDNESLSYIIQSDDSTSLIEYNNDFCGNSFVKYDDMPDDALLNDSLISGSTFFGLYDDMTLRAFDLDSEKELWSKDIPADYYTDIHLLGLSSDGQSLFYSNCPLNREDDKGVFQVAMSDGDTKKLDIEWGRYTEPEFRLSNDILYYNMVDNSDYPNVRYYSVAYDIAGKKTTKTRVFKDGSGTLTEDDTLYPSPDGKYMINISTDRNNTGIRILIDLESKETYGNKMSSGDDVIAWKEDSSGFAQEYDNTIRLFDTLGEETATFNTEGKNALHMEWHNGILDVLFDGGDLVRYNADGTIIEKINLNSVGNYYDHDWVFDYSDKYLIITNSFHFFLISQEDFRLIGSGTGLLGFYNEKERLICRSFNNTGGSGIGYFPIRTLDELIQDARDYLKDAKMSDEFKAQYGITMSDEIGDVAVDTGE